TTEIMAVLGSCSQAGPWIPNHPRNSLTSPSCGLYIHTQNCEITVEASRNGMKNDSRQNHWPGRPRLTSTARPMAMATSGIVDSTVNQAVFASELHTWESPNASAQLSRPMKSSLVPAMLTPVKLIHSP